MKLFSVPLTLFPLVSSEITKLTHTHKNRLSHTGSNTSRDVQYWRIHENISYLSKLIVAFALWLLLTILHRNAHTNPHALTHAQVEWQ